MSSLQNLKTPDNYQPAPSVLQKGGSRYKNKRGGTEVVGEVKLGKIVPIPTTEDDVDLEMGLNLKEKFADDDDYDKLLVDAEEGNAGPWRKVGGSRKRRHGRKSRKTRKGGKSHRRSKKGGKRSRKSRK